MPHRIPPRKISILADKWLKGTISDEEMREFNEWYNQFNDEEATLSEDPDANGSDIISARMLNNVRRRVQQEQSTVVSLHHKSRWYRITAAAVVAGVIGCAGLMAWWISK